MGARGPKPNAARRVIEGGFGTRPLPPADATPEEAELWRETTSSEPAGFFASAASRAMLKDYCRHRITADKITSVINLFKAEWLKNAEGSKRYAMLLKMRDLEARGAAGMATKLRLTNQSRYTPQAAGTAARANPTVPPPWEFGR